MRKLSFSTVRLSVVATLCVIAIVLIDAVRYLLGQATAVEGNVDDFFIALNAGYVVTQEGLAHPSLHSPFGVVYFLLSSNAFRLIERFPQWLSFDKIHMISSLQWMVVIVAFFAAFRQLQPAGKRFEPWLLALLLLISVQARDIGSFSPLPNWYGIYNYQLWALLILQAANHYSWRSGRAAGRTAAVLGMLEATVLVIAFNYKISFFVAGCALSLLPLFYLSDLKARVTYYAALVATGAMMMAILAGLGVPLWQYLRDVMFVGQAKTVRAFTVLGQLGAALGYTFVAGRVLSDSTVGDGDRQAFAERFVAMWRRYAFHGLVAAAVAVGALGDYFVPWWPYAMVGLWAVVSGTRGRSAGDPQASELSRASVVAAIPATALACFALVSVNFIADTANSRPTQSGVVPGTIDFSPRSLDFIQFLIVAGPDDLLASRLYARPPDFPQQLFEYSYRADGDGSRLVVESIGIISATNYIKDVNATARWLNEHGAPARGRVAISHLGFVNPWPLLTGNSFIAGSPHWLHMGTTVTVQQIDTYLDAMSAADVVVVPLLSVHRKQAVLDCAFYQWNMRNGSQFVPQHLAGYNLIFVRKGGRIAADGPAPVQVDEADIRKHCDDVLAAARLNNEP